MQNREVIEKIVTHSVEGTVKMLETLGVDSIQYDAIDIAVLTDKMANACHVDMAELETVEEFMESDLFKRYQKTVTDMTEILVVDISAKMSGVMKH